MDFALSDEVEKYRRSIRHFVAQHILPLEADPANADEHENIRVDVLQLVRAKVKAAGLWAIQMPVERGGRGLNVAGMAACYEEMGRSIYGPVCFNSAAPDDGNMIVLNRVATEAQKDRWLQPIVDGEVRSSFVMTEPMPGSGSDPSAMRTFARREADKWVIDGHKWFITGADAANHFILIARKPGWEIVRRIPIMGPEEHGGHCEIKFNGLEIPDENRLMEVGDGLKLTQIRLGTARLTHCMRWLGMAKRAIEICMGYVQERRVFGSTLADHEGVQWLLGEAVMQIEIGRLLTMRAAAKLDAGDFARKEVSMAKIVVSETLHKAIDTAIQLMGARGYSKDTPLEWMYRYARQARLVDGASETHKMVLSRSLMAEGMDFWSWD